MAGKGQFISCAQYQSYLMSRTPVYDEEILKDIRPSTAELLGYYRTGTWDAYTGVEHTFDRFHHVHPDTTRPWSQVTDTACGGRPCDPEENKIGWGWSRETYRRDTQSWGSDILCFDQMMTKTKAKEHFRQIIDQILRPATAQIMSAYLMRKACENAGTKICVTTGLPTFTFTWDPGGYVFLTTTATPTGRLTPEILRAQTRRHYLNGAIEASEKGYESLELQTDEDTFHYLAKEHPTLKELWRFGTFNQANDEYWKKGFNGFVGDFMVKCFKFPLKFNKISAYRYQQVLPYYNVATDEGIKSVYNPDYDAAQYVFSIINHRRYLKVLPFKPEALNAEMPFLVRDYGGKWTFATNDLGADSRGRPIDNSRKNKGKFIADFDVAVKPERPEFATLFFHLTDRMAITIIGVSNTDPGYPDQDYTMSNPPCGCDSYMTFVAEADQGGRYKVAANSIRLNGAEITHAAIDSASLAAFVVDLQARWDTASIDGTWAVVDGTARTFKITWSASETDAGTIEIPFDLT